MTYLQRFINDWQDTRSYEATWYWPLITAGCLGVVTYLIIYLIGLLGQPSWENTIAVLLQWAPFWVLVPLTSAWIRYFRSHRH